MSAREKPTGANMAEVVSNVMTELERLDPVQRLRVLGAVAILCHADEVASASAQAARLLAEDEREGA